MALTTEENELLCRTDAGTPAGELMRRYWHPVALSEELPPEGAPLPVTVFGEELVLFRDEQGRPGLLGLHCSHRGADLSYGRLEDGGIRCIYHGWLYDIHGNCLEQPGEPSGSSFHQRIRHPAFPCVERSGAIWAYMGPGEPPLLPNYTFLTVPDENVYATKVYNDCNYLQGNEGNIDLIHLSFLHHNSMRDAGGGNGVAPGIVTGQGAAPRQEVVEAELTDCGLKVCKVRDLGKEKHLYFCTYIMPSAFAFSGNITNEGYSVNWHVPIDDEHHWKFTFIFSSVRAVDKDALRRGRVQMGADYKPIRNKANRYLQDRSTFHESFTGIGLVFQVQDLCVVEGPGPIQDRTQEHLGTADAPLVIARKLMMKGIKDVQEGLDPHGVIRDPAANRFPLTFALSVNVPAETDWRAYFREVQTRQLDEAAVGH